MKNTTKIIVLAAGKGTRMATELPKVLVQVKGRSMISRLMEAIEKSGIDPEPVVIVGYKKELVIEELKKTNHKCHFISQDEQLGTGHAVNMAKEYLIDKGDNILILYGDMPLIHPETIRKINDKHIKSGKKITMATVKLPDFKDWHINFVNFSRIIRNKEGQIIKDIQFKDATDEEIKITEVNPCYFCFDAEWLWHELSKIKKNNVQEEYYLTDLIKIATEEGVETESIDIEPHEALGANTRAELAILEKFST
ncbi:MAG: NTP transferase domain-containing protein [Candidatus Paceibacterota bacterium]